MESNLAQKIANATRKARQETLDAGKSIIEEQDGWLVQVHPDGTIEKLTQLPPHTKVDKTKTYIVKKGL